MTPADMLDLLRADLQNPPTTVNNYLQHLLEVAKGRIAQEGIQLDSNDIDDVNLQIMYAAWLYRARNTPENPMPRMLRFALNNRIFCGRGQADAVR